MTQIYSEPAQKTISINRLIGKIEGNPKDPTVVFFSGIHGNEKAGVFALEEVFGKINPEETKGTIYGILGNLKALEANRRYIDQDLNRLWTDQNLETLEKKKKQSVEEKEQLELLKVLKNIMDSNKGPFYFIDLHTTSSKSAPFITINDAVINRRFSKQFPVPIVLGIEEYLNGPLLSYINSLGYMSLGFESGQHDDVNSITNSVAFIYLSLVFANVVNRENIPDFEKYYKRLQIESKTKTGFFEIIDLHRIGQRESFKMLNSFENFEFVKKNTPLAVSNLKNIESKYNAQVFMPLYQAQGEEGFFIIRKIKPFFLKLSVILRRLRVDGLLVLLPGISWANSEKQILLVNLKTARFLAKPIFHLLGYRNRQLDKAHLKLFNRERTAKTKMYKNESWYKSGKT